MHARNSSIKFGGKYDEEGIAPGYNMTWLKTDNYTSWAKTAHSVYMGEGSSWSRNKVKETYENEFEGLVEVPKNNKFMVALEVEYLHAP